MKEQTIQTLTDNRVKLDFIGKKINNLKRTRATASAATALELGRMYLGEVCFSLGKDYPYHKTKKATKPSEIEPSVDLSDKNPEIVGNEIEEINKLREVIDQINKNSIETINEFLVDSPLKGLDKFYADCNVSQAYRSIKESRMWLGVRLKEIREADSK